MTTQIDRIINYCLQWNGTGTRSDLKKFLEAELTSVNGVDELVEKRTKAEGVVAKSGYILVDEFISDLKSLKHTPVKDSQQKEVEKAKKCLQCGTHYNGGTIKFCSSDCCLKWNGMK